MLESQQFILGPEVKQFEEEIAAKLGARYAIGCASGTDALILALWRRGSVLATRSSPLRSVLWLRLGPLPR